MMTPRRTCLHAATNDVACASACMGDADDVARAGACMGDADDVARAGACMGDADNVARAGAGPAGGARMVEKPDVRRDFRPQTRRVFRVASEVMGPVGLGRKSRRPSGTRALL